jgi:hypothetical protein
MRKQQRAQRAPRVAEAGEFRHAPTRARMRRNTTNLHHRNAREKRMEREWNANGTRPFCADFRTLFDAHSDHSERFQTRMTGATRLI